MPHGAMKHYKSAAYQQPENHGGSFSRKQRRSISSDLKLNAMWGPSGQLLWTQLLAWGSRGGHRTAVYRCRCSENAVNLEPRDNPRPLISALGARNSGTGTPANLLRILFWPQRTLQKPSSKRAFDNIHGNIALIFDGNSWPWMMADPVLPRQSSLGLASAPLPSWTHQAPLKLILPPNTILKLPHGPKSRKWKWRAISWATELTDRALSPLSLSEEPFSFFGPNPQ